MNHVDVDVQSDVDDGRGGRGRGPLALLLYSCYCRSGDVLTKFEIEKLMEKMKM